MAVLHVPVVAHHVGWKGLTGGWGGERVDGGVRLPVGCSWVGLDIFGCMGWCVGELLSPPNSSHQAIIIAPIDCPLQPHPERQHINL